MIGRIRIAFLFFFLAAASGHEERSLTVYDLPVNEVEEYNGKYVNVNKIFDQIHPKLHDLLIKLGMDPMELVDFSEPVIKLPGKLGSKIDFTNGFMHGMSDVRRTQDITLKYEDKVLSLDMDLGWQKLDMNYQYRYDHLLTHRSGHLFGLFKDIDSHVRVNVNLYTYTLSMDSLKFMRVGDFALTLSDNKDDGFLNFLIKATSKIFRTLVLEHLEERTFDIFKGVFEKFNKQIPKPERIRLLENFNEVEFRRALFSVVKNGF